MAVNITQIAAATADPKVLQELSDPVLARYLDDARQVLPYTSGYSDAEKQVASVVVGRLNAEFNRRLQATAAQARKLAEDAQKGSGSGGGKKPAPKTPAQQEATQAQQQAEAAPTSDSGGSGIGTVLLIGGGTAATVILGWLVYDQYEQGAFNR